MTKKTKPPKITMEKLKAWAEYRAAIKNRVFEIARYYLGKTGEDYDRLKYEDEELRAYPEGTLRVLYYVNERYEGDVHIPFTMITSADWKSGVDEWVASTKAKEEDDRKYRALVYAQELFKKYPAEMMNIAHCQREPELI